MKKSSNLWSKDELILTLGLYLELPFGKIHHKHPKIIELSCLIDRTPSAVAMRLSNFANVDPIQQDRGIVGLSGGKNKVGPIWNEYANRRDLLENEINRIKRSVLED